MNATQARFFVHSLRSTFERSGSALSRSNPRSRNIDVDSVGDRRYSKIAETPEYF